MVVVGPVNLPVTRLFVEEIILECRQKRITKVDLLGFEFEMGLFPNVLDEAKAKGHRHSAEVHPGRGVRQAGGREEPGGLPRRGGHRGEAAGQGNTVAVQLTDFSVFYSQDPSPTPRRIAQGEGQQDRRGEGPDRQGEQGQERRRDNAKLTKTWTDWIDYWSVDFDFESKRE